MTDEQMALFDNLGARAVAGDANAMAMLERLGQDSVDEWLTARAVRDERQRAAAEAAAMNDRRGVSRIAGILHAAGS